MNYNPYAAPQAAPPPPGAPLAYGGGGPQPWDIGEVLTAAFEALKVNWVVMVFTYFTSFAISEVLAQGPKIPVFIGVFRNGSMPALMLGLGGAGVAWVVSSFFQVGLIRIWLAVARGQPADFSLLFSGADRFLPMLGTLILMGLAIGFGFLLLVVPGVIISLGLMLGAFFVVDQGMSPVDALQASWRATDGQKGKLFGFACVMGVIIFASACCCFLPFFVALPTIMVGMTIVYLRITGRGAAAIPGPGATPGPGGGYSGPFGGGGYGPPGGGGYAPPGGGGYAPPGAGGPAY